MNNPGIIFHHVPILKLSLPLKHLTFCYFLQKRLEKEKFDIVHSMERTFYQDIFRVSDGINPVQMQQRYPNPAIRRFKAAGPRRQVLSYLERNIFLGDGCRAIMTNSKLLRRHILEHFPVDPEKITVIYNGIDISRFNPGVKKIYRAPMRKYLGITPDQTAVLFASNDFKLKQLGLILKALSMLKDPSFSLLIAGSDSSRPYRQWIKDNRMHDRILFLGPQEKIEKAYAAADIFVLPTLYDAFANVCLEAMACGLPVLTTVNNGAAELIQDGVQGFVLKSSAPGELTARLASFKKEKRRTLMGEQAAQTASVFTQDRHLSEVLKLYEKIRFSKNY